MPRTLEVTTPVEKTESLLERIKGIDGVVGVSVQHRAGRDPSPGDVVTIHATNDGTRAVLHLLDELHVSDGGSIVTSDVRSLIAPPFQNGIDKESNETIWEEMAFLLRRETNLSFNYLALMALSGGIAAVGLWTDTLHIVIGAMVVAPGFEPLLRIGFGLVGGPAVLARRGALSSVLGYLSVAVGASLTLLLLRLVDGGAAPNLASRSWVQYWSSIKPPAIVLSAVASAAGAVTITAQRTVLSAGVMIALALVPGMAIAGMALVSGDLALAWSGLVRWGLDAIVVALVGTLVLGLKQAFVHRRSSLA